MNLFIAVPWLWGGVALKENPTRYYVELAVNMMLILVIAYALLSGSA